MVGNIPKLDKGAWAGIALWTTATALVFAGASGTVAALIMTANLGTLMIPGLLAAVLMPLTMTPPIMVPLLVRHHELKRSNTELRELAFQDSLLDCMNRRGFTATVDIALQYASAHRPCALLIIDADNFKSVNDRFGHDRGDQALQLMAETIKSTIRSADILGRIGGEEFGVYLPGAGDTSARATAERIRQAVAAIAFAPNGEPHELSVSIGGAVAVAPASFSQLYREADQRLYAAKNDGRNRAQFDGFAEAFTPSSVPRAEPGEDTAIA